MSDGTKKNVIFNNFIKILLIFLRKYYLFGWIVSAWCRYKLGWALRPSWQCGWFQMSIKRYCFFNLGLKRRVCNALSTTLGRWIGFLCSRSRLLVDPLLFFFVGPLSLAQSWSAFSSESCATRGTRKTQLEWRSCSAELEATVGVESREPEDELRLKAALRPALTPGP